MGAAAETGLKEAIAMKTLIVDDSSTMRRIVRNALEGAGYKDVIEASNGVEACKAADDADLILMDWNMPEMSGIEAVHKIRGDGNKTPIIMVTTEAEKKRIIEAVQAGINDYMVKPFRPEDLIQKVNKHAPG